MRHPLFLIAAMLLAGASAMAQTTHFALAYDSDNSTVVYTDDGRRFDLDGRVLDLGMDRQTVWTLTTGAKNYLYNNMAFNDFRVYKNDARVKTYKGSSLAAPQKVYTFRLNESAESYKLAISRY